MQNIGEEITGAWLQVCKDCEFIQYNLHTPDIQGEIDVIGINTKQKILYICEVAIHLVTGIQYVRNNQPDNIKRFLKKFEKDIEYAENYFGDYEKKYMLWSPIVKNQSENAKHNQMRDLSAIKEELFKDKSIDLELVINEEYQNRLNELRKYAAKTTKELKSPVLRYLQIEEHLKKHLSCTSKRLH